MLQKYSFHSFYLRYVMSACLNSSTLFLLDQCTEDRANGLGALLQIPLLASLIVHIRDTEPGLVPLGPLKIVHQTPREVTSNISTVLDRSRQRMDVSPEVLCAELVIQDLLLRHVV